MPLPSRRRRLAVAVLTAGVLTVPGVAHAAPPASAGVPAAAPDRTAVADLTWTLVRAQNPTQEQQEAYDLITSAMNAAVARYNNLSDLGKTITVYYEPSVPTADGNINGTIRFGNRAYMTERTALHEIAHTLGVGTSGSWDSLSSGGTWHGARATALLQQYDGAGATISCGGGHFWPYGLNYEDEFSQTAADRHVELVEAMVADGL